jgi:hypothetical protein
MLVSTDMINSWRENKQFTENTGNVSVSRAGIGPEVHNEEANILLCPHLSRTMQDKMTA